MRGREKEGKIEGRSPTLEEKLVRGGYGSSPKRQIWLLETSHYQGFPVKQGPNAQAQLGGVFFTLRSMSVNLMPNTF